MEFQTTIDALKKAILEGEEQHVDAETAEILKTEIEAENEGLLVEILDPPLIKTSLPCVTVKIKD